MPKHRRVSDGPTSPPRCAWHLPFARGGLDFAQSKASPSQGEVARRAGEVDGAGARGSCAMLRLSRAAIAAARTAAAGIAAARGVCAGGSTGDGPGRTGRILTRAGARAARVRRRRAADRTGRLLAAGVAAGVAAALLHKIGENDAVTAVAGRTHTKNLLKKSPGAGAPGAFYGAGARMVSGFVGFCLDRRYRPVLHGLRTAVWRRRLLHKNHPAGSFRRGADVYSSCVSFTMSWNLAMTRSKFSFRCGNRHPEQSLMPFSL